MYSNCFSKSKSHCEGQGQVNTILYYSISTMPLGLGEKVSFYRSSNVSQPQVANMVLLLNVSGTKPEVYACKLSPYGDIFLHILSIQANDCLAYFEQT